MCDWVATTGLASSDTGLLFVVSRERAVVPEDVRAEMVSTVFQVVVAQGDVVAVGDTLVILESMKMEIPVLAETAGTVTNVAVDVGDVIKQGDLIAVVS